MYRQENLESRPWAIFLVDRFSLELPPSVSPRNECETTWFRTHVESVAHSSDARVAESVIRRIASACLNSQGWRRPPGTVLEGWKRRARGQERRIVRARRPRYGITSSASAKSRPSDGDSRLCCHRLLRRSTAHTPETDVVPCRSNTRHCCQTPKTL